MQKVKLKDIATIRFGYNAEHQTKGNTQYLLARHFNELGQIKTIDSYIDINDKSIPHLLQHNDILFTGKGLRFFAYCYDKHLGQAIASSLFYVIKVKSGLFLPNFISIYLNQPQSIAFFRQSGAGSNIPSIRKSELEDFEFPLISIEKQQNIIHFHQLHIHSLLLLRQLEQQKQVLANRLIDKLINS